jgi:hypothetical protein
MAPGRSFNLDVIGLWLMGAIVVAIVAVAMLVY